MFDWLSWFTRLDHSKIFSLVLFFGAFCGVVVYIFGNRRRGARLESYKHIPFQDDEPTDPRAAPARRATDGDER